MTDGTGGDGRTRTVIVGGSLGGVRTAENLREAGYAGEVVLVEAEAGPPYDRPPLSKDVLAGGRTRHDIALTSAADLADLDIRFVDGVLATGLDLAERTVELSGGTILGYDHLVVATGAAPGRLPHDCTQVAYLRSFDDAERIRASFEAGCRLVVIGGGFIGAEVAAAARARGLPVTVLEAAPVPLARVLGTDVGRLLGDLHVEHGVELRCGVQVVGIQDRGDAAVVHLADGAALPADLVVVGIGATPNVEWLAGSGLTLDDGVVCDETCQAVGATGVYAVGDVARWWNPRYEALMRVEHWTNAAEQAQAVADAITGTPRPYAHVPYVWSKQYGHMIQVLGRFSGGAPRIRTPAEGVRGLCAWYGPAGSVEGLLTVDQPRLMVKARRALAAGASGIELAQLVAAHAETVPAILDRRRPSLSGR